MISPWKTKWGSITVPLPSCLTGLDQSVLQIKTKIVSCHTADSKPVKQEVNGTVILPPVVFPDQPSMKIQTCKRHYTDPKVQVQNLNCFIFLFYFFFQELKKKKDLTKRRNMISAQRCKQFTVVTYDRNGVSCELPYSGHAPAWCCKNEMS